MYSVEIRDENTADGAVLCAKLALVAKAVVDRCEIVHDLDRARGAILFALLAAYASIGAFLSCRCALFLITAGNKDLINVSHQRDDTLRTSLYTHSAARTKSGIYVSYAVFNTNCI